MKWTPVIAIIAISGLEAIALIHNVNGAMLGLAFAVIGALGGQGQAVSKKPASRSGQR